MATKKVSKERLSLLDEQQQYRANIGKRYRELREVTGLSQEKFANEYNLDRRHISRIESGATNLKLDTLVEYIRPFNASLSAFFADIK